MPFTTGTGSTHRSSEQTHVLDPEPVRDRREQLDVEFGEQMRRDRHAPGVGDGGDLAQFGEAAAHRIGLQDRQPRIFEERLEVEAGEMRLAADDAQIERLGDPQIAGEIVGASPAPPANRRRTPRNLRPIWMATSAVQPMLTSIMMSMSGPTASRMRLTLSRSVCERADVGDLHLDRLVALLLEVQRLRDHAVAAAAAETAAAVGRHLRAVMAPQPMQRHVRALADRVPQRDVERRHRHRRRCRRGRRSRSRATDRCQIASTAVASLPMTRGMIVSSRHAAMVRSVGAEQEQIAHADDAARGLHLEHQDVARVAEARGP